MGFHTGLHRADHFSAVSENGDEQTRPPYNRKPIVPTELSWASLMERDGEERRPRGIHEGQIVEGVGASLDVFVVAFFRMLIRTDPLIGHHKTLVRAVRTDLHFGDHRARS